MSHAFTALISHAAILVITGTIPIDLLGKEMKYVADRKNSAVTTKKTERIITVQKWEEQWSQETKGTWTMKIIKNLDAWINRKHEEIEF